MKKKMDKNVDIKSKIAVANQEMQNLIGKLQSCLNTENELKKAIIDKQGYIRALSELVNEEPVKVDNKE